MVIANKCAREAYMHEGRNRRMTRLERAGKGTGTHAPTHRSESAFSLPHSPSYTLSHTPTLPRSLLSSLSLRTSLMFSHNLSLFLVLSHTRSLFLIRAPSSSYSTRSLFLILALSLPRTPSSSYSFPLPHTLSYSLLRRSSLTYYILSHTLSLCALPYSPYSLSLILSPYALPHTLSSLLLSLSLSLSYSLPMFS